MYTKHYWNIENNEKICEIHYDNQDLTGTIINFYLKNNQKHLSKI